MRNLKVASAVAAVLASSAGYAANLDVYISGASAQKNFWYQDLANIANCPVNTLVGAKWGGPATSPQFSKAGDFSFVQCSATAPNPAGVGTGTTVTFHYSAELGSVWGVANMLGQNGVAGYPTTHIFLQAGGCSTGAYTASNAFFATSCNPSGATKYALYTPGLGAGVSGSDQVVGFTGAIVAPAAGALPFVTATPDVDVADLEPSKFELADNWSTKNYNGFDTGAPNNLYAALGPVPTSSQVGQISGVNVNGEVFAVIVNPGQGAGNLFADPGNLSSQSLSAIFQGDYKKWNQLPELGAAGGNNTINICRRDHGSGSQVAASLFFTGTECGLINDGGFSEETIATSSPPGPAGSAPGNPGFAFPVELNNATSGMRACVNGQAGSIGFLSEFGNLPGQNEADNYNVESVDGVQPNAHNAAAGYYKFATQTYAYSPAADVIGQLLITRAQTQANLSAVAGNETVTQGANMNGLKQFTSVATAAGQPLISGAVGVYPLPGLITGQSGSTAGVNTLVALPVALRSNSGESCTVLAGQNTN